MTIAQCPTCKVFPTFPNSHKCAPRFLYLDHDYTGDKWDERYFVHAYDAESAAEDAAEEMDNDGGEGASERTIHIKDSEGNVTVWSICFDYSVTYSATEETP